MSKFLKKLKRRLLEPSSVAGYAGMPAVAVVGSILFPAAAPLIAIGSAAVGGALVGRKEKATAAAERAEAGPFQDY